MSDAQWDVIIVGAGLHGALISLALLDAEPELRLLLIERDLAPCGNHTWCFHGGELAAAGGGWAAALPLVHWPGYEVLFPDHRRELRLGYCCLRSEALAGALGAAFARSRHARLACNTAARSVGGEHVVLEDGRRLEAPLVIAATGAVPGGALPRCGWQKFFGLEVELAADSGLDRPILMDARVPQEEGFRFMYVLPFEGRRLLVEDTVFAVSAELDETRSCSRIRRYLARRGWRVRRVLRSERGVLPMPWSGLLPRPAAPLAVGYAGGWFHPATGYSAGWALRLAAAIAAHRRDPWRALAGAWRRCRRQARFAHLLNAMAFLAFRPEAMWHPYSRFYRLPEPLVFRFHAMAATSADVARILVGRPPKGFGSALISSRGR